MRELTQMANGPLRLIELACSYSMITIFTGEIMCNAWDNPEHYAGNWKKL